MSFYTSLSGLQAAQTDMATISHNIANVGTDGFKKSRTSFADVIASSVYADPTKVVGSGTVVKSIRQQFNEGSLITTSSLARSRRCRRRFLHRKDQRRQRQHGLYP